MDEDPLREAFRVKLMLALYRSGRQVDALRVMQDYRRRLGEEVGLEPSPELVQLERQILAHDEDLQLAEPAGRPLRGYRLGERLGTGRDGTVYAARLPGVERDLAIRAVPAEIADRPDVVRSFDSVLRRVASLRQEAVVPVHDHWREPGAAYVVMRRMWGGSLRDRLDRGPLPIADVAALAERVGSALAAAHGQGVVHGRVTADSVLCDESGGPYLADFPLGDPGIDEGTDVRAFAALVAEAVTGGGPFGAEREGLPPAVADVLATAQHRDDVPALRDLLPALVTALDLAAGVTPPGAPAPVNPYKGLRAFDESDAADFFGRTELVEEMLRRLSGEGQVGRLVLLVGGSGSGKSSVVRAGLLPRVRAGAVPGSRRWFVTTMVPGTSPFKELAEGLSRVATATGGTDGDGDAGDRSDARADEDLVAALAGDASGFDAVLRRVVPDSGQLLLVVDQLEELFTMAGEDDQRAFLDAVVYAVSAPDSRLRVVATLRADFYDRPLRFHRFGAAVRDATVTVPAMSAADLEAAVTGPAERVGTRVDPALVAELVAAVVDQAAALPSLQFTLFELAERSDDGHLALAAYRELGGVDGAIASRAEALYRSLDDDERATVRRLFEHLVVIGAEGEPTRRRTPGSELTAVAPDQDVDDLVDAWARARLLTYDRHPRTREPTVEVAHEALLREWPRLRAWLVEDRGAIVAAGQIRDAAEDWKTLDRDPGALYRGARLETALSQVEAREDALPATAREFLAASRAARDEEARREAERATRQARANRRLRLQLVALAVALVIALVGGLLAFDQRQRAEDEQAVAVARELAAASEANLGDDPELSVLLALEAVGRTGGDDGSPLPEAESALHRAVTASRIVLTVPGLGGAVDWSPDGTVFVTEGPEETGLIDIRDAETGESVLSFTGHDIDVNDVAFSADGSMLATVGDDGAARVWDVATGDELASLQGEGQAWGVALSPDGTRLAAGWPNEGVVRVLDLTSGETARQVRAQTAVGPGATSFSPDGERLAIAAGLDGVVVVDAASGDDVLRFRPSIWGTVTVAWSPDGRWIASGSRDADADITDAATGELHRTLVGHTGPLVGIDWAPGGDRLATGSEDGTARVWEITESGVRELLAVAARETQGGAGGVAFSPDGERLLTGDAGIRAAKIWDVGISGGAEWANLPAPDDVLGSAVFTPDGRSVVATGDGVPAVVWDVATGEPERSLGPEDREAHPAVVEAAHVDVSPDGALVLTVTLVGTVRVWDARTGEEAFTVGEGFTANGGAWSPDGELLAVTGTDGERGWITIVDRTGQQVAEIPEESDHIPLSVEFSPDGEQIVTTRTRAGRQDATVDGVRVWEWAEGEAVTDIPVYAQPLSVNPTGDRLATSDRAGGAALWDAATGELTASLSGHIGAVNDVAFSPDGRSVATASADGAVRLFSAESGDLQLVLRGHEGPVGSVAFSPDGSRLVSMSLGEARVWALDLDDLVEIAESRLTRTLTDVECRQYLHVDHCSEA